MEAEKQVILEKKLKLLMSFLIYVAYKVKQQDQLSKIFKNETNIRDTDIMIKKLRPTDKEVTSFITGNNAKVSVLEFL